MTGPLRFFCHHCTQMIKIGRQMAGRVVVCPQCGTRLAVPLQSDPTAEAVYKAQRERRAAEKAAGIPSQPSHQGPLPGLFTSPTPSKPGEHPGDIGKNHGHSATPAETPETDEELDRWIDDFWKTPSVYITPAGETDATLPADTSIALPPPHPSTPHLPTLPTPPRPPGDPVNILHGYSDTTDYPETSVLPSVSSETAAPASPPPRPHNRLRFLLWTFLNILVGFILGVAAHSELQKSRDRRPAGAAAAQRYVENDSDADTVTGSNIVALRGTLLYTDEEGWGRPDIEAVAVFLPLDHPPAIPFSPEGLGIGPETGKTREGMLAIEEIGGTYVRTNTSGGFDAILSAPGDYLVLYISAASQRSATASLPEKDLTLLKRFFQNPERLIGQSQYCCREITFSRDTRPLKYQFDYSR